VRTDTELHRRPKGNKVASSQCHLTLDRSPPKARHYSRRAGGARDLSLTTFGTEVVIGWCEPA
jgi:hypothetical protein